jgi:hypothetical protein
MQSVQKTAYFLTDMTKAENAAARKHPTIPRRARDVAKSAWKKVSFLSFSLAQIHVQWYNGIINQLTFMSK